MIPCVVYSGPLINWKNATMMMKVTVMGKKKRWRRNSVIFFNEYEASWCVHRERINKEWVPNSESKFEVKQAFETTVSSQLLTILSPWVLLSVG